MIRKSHFIGEHIDNVEKSYEFIKELGKGSYGQVFRCQNKITGNVYACKKMSKTRFLLLNDRVVRGRLCRSTLRLFVVDSQQKN